MRIASLLPAATEWVCAFGAADQLVARSHECDFPPGSLGEVAVVTKATYATDSPTDASADSRAIDKAVREQLERGLSLYDVDVERLRALRPDLVLTQTQCEVCAVSRQQLEAHLATWGADAGRQGPQLFSLAPATLKEVFDTGLALGRATGRLEAAMPFLGEHEKRLRALREEMGLPKQTDSQAGPTVACIEWMDPLMTAGHWTPDLAEQAGGRAVLSEKGVRSRPITWDDLREADPDVLAVMPCGFALEDTIRDLDALIQRPGFGELRAVREGRLFLFDGNAYFNRPGPRLYRSAELLAAALHPERARPFVEPEPGEMRRLSEVAA